jgi:hypothetical protein
MTRRRVNSVRWVFVALALLGARPSGGCLCADGRYELVCTAPGCNGSLSRNSRGTPRNQCCGCSCCRSNEATSGVGNGCCSRQSAASIAHHNVNRPSDVTGCCCQAVPSEPMILAVATPVPDPAAVSPTNLVHSVVLVPDVNVRPFPIGLDAGPPFDRAVVFRHLLI